MILQFHSVPGPYELQRNCLNFLLFLALVAILFSRAEWSEQFWYRTSQRTILSSLVEICPEVTEEMLFEVAFVLFLALAATLCSEVSQFEQF